MERLLRKRAGSPLVEEGILLSLTVITLAVVLSLITTLFGGISKVVGGASSSVSSFFESAIKNLDDLLKQLYAFVSGR
jgi:hypothetical protein